MSPAEGDRPARQQTGVGVWGGGGGKQPRPQLQGGHRWQEKRTCCHMRGDVQVRRPHLSWDGAGTQFLRGWEPLLHCGWFERLPLMLPRTLN